MMASDDPIHIAFHPRPLVSVLLLLFGRADLALQAIRHLVAQTEPCFELIVIDNDSPDDALDVLRSRVHGATFVSNPLNAGFGAGMNVGAMRARGEHLLLLNSDVFVEAGWLPPLLAALAASPALAAVSPAFVHLDGTLQEAGSVIFRHGGTAAVSPSEEAATAYQRTVPYVSAACLLIRRQVFGQLGGFDTIYGRGYFEDVELALEIDSLGMHVGYVPRSRATHARGGSTTPTRAARVAEHNRHNFAERWNHRLEHLPGPVPPWETASFLRARDAFSPDRILIVDDRVPQVDRGSGDPRMALIACGIARRHPAARVTFFSASNEHVARYSPALHEAGVEVADANMHNAAAWFEARTGHFSAVMLSRPDNFLRFRVLVDHTQPQAIKVIDVEAVYSNRTAMQARLRSVDGRSHDHALLALAAQQRAVEFESWNWASIVVCVSEDEAAIVRAVAPTARVLVVGFAEGRPERVAERHGRSGAVFFGGFMSGDTAPNADSVEFLVGDLLPLIVARRPDLSLTIAGADPSKKILDLHGPGVDVVGRVDDPLQLLGSKLVHLVPMRFGAGIKLKLIQSMAAGLPFVTTSCGAEGLQLGELAPLIVADEPRLFAERAVELLEDSERWNVVQQRLLAIASEHFSHAAFDHSLDELLVELGVPAPSLLPIGGRL